MAKSNGPCGVTWQVDYHFEPIRPEDAATWKDVSDFGDILTEECLVVQDREAARVSAARSLICALHRSEVARREMTEVLLEMGFVRPNVLSRDESAKIMARQGQSFCSTSSIELGDLAPPSEDHDQPLVLGDSDSA